MNIERVALGVLTLACLGLGFWNTQLHRELSEAHVVIEASDSRVAAVTANGDSTQDKRHRNSASPSEEAYTSDGKQRGPREATVIGEASANGQPKQEERPERDWAAIRSEMESKTVENVDSLSQKRGWDGETADEVLTILLESGDAMSAIWTDMHNEEITHYEARKEMHSMRNDMEEELVGLIGEEDYELLDEQLFESRRATWGGGRH
ncbi:MAG: hypothetical protein GWP91_18105 [Rhodobacterales bacterium]|nr:hypothetical protein [Rhodobacterales bacterium]